MKNIIKKILPIILSSSICFIFSGCNKNNPEENILSTHIENFKSSTTNNDNHLEDSGSSIKNNTKDNPFSFCTNIKLDEEKLKNLLKCKIGEKEYKLVPVMDNDEDKQYWKDLVTKDENYVKTFFLGRHTLSEKDAEYMFRETIRHMWKTTPPIELFFKVYLNDERCGIFMCDYLDTDDEVEFAYMTEKKFTNQKVASTSVKIIVDFLKYLNETKFYNIKTVSLWIFDENKASIQVAKNNDFKFVEKDPPNKRSKYSLNI